MSIEGVPLDELSSPLPLMRLPSPLSLSHMWLTNGLCRSKVKSTAAHHRVARMLWFCQQICHRGRCMAVCGRSEHGGVIRDSGSTSLPSFRSRNGGETLCAAIIHYMAMSARLQ
jgi:hypothetical protein